MSNQRFDQITLNAVVKWTLGEGTIYCFYAVEGNVVPFYCLYTHFMVEFSPDTASCAEAPSCSYQRFGKLGSPRFDWCTNQRLWTTWRRKELTSWTKPLSEPSPSPHFIHNQQQNNQIQISGFEVYSKFDCSVSLPYHHSEANHFWCNLAAKPNKTPAWSCI